MRQPKVITADEAAALVNDGDVLMAGGFGMTGNPVHLLHALAKTPVRRLTYVGNNVGEPGLGGGRLLQNGQIARAIGSYITSNRDVVDAAESHAIEVELMPQGTLAEAIRAGGAGIGAFYTPTGHATRLAEGREMRVFHGIPHVLVEGLRANVAFVRAWRADTAGNLVYRMTEQNFNRAMAMAADIVVAEVEQIVPVGALAPDSIHTPGVFVDYLVEAHTTLAEVGSSATVEGTSQSNDDRRCASRDERSASSAAETW